MEKMKVKTGWWWNGEATGRWRKGRGITSKREEEEMGKWGGVVPGSPCPLVLLVTPACLKI